MAKIIIRIREAVSVCILCCDVRTLVVRTVRTNAHRKLRTNAHRKFFFCFHTNQQDRGETVVLADRNRKLGRLFATYARGAGYQLGSLRFIVDGNAVDHRSTPNVLIEEGATLLIETAEDGTQREILPIQCNLRKHGG
jgi:hypothetical protein